MATARLKYNADDWDANIRLTIRGSVPKLIVIPSAADVVELNRIFTIAYFQDHEGNISFSLDCFDYTLEADEWKAVLDATDKWLANYLPATHPELYEEPAEPTIGFNHGV